MGIPLTEPRPKPPDDTVHVQFAGQQSSMTWACVMWLKVVASSRNGTDLSALMTTLRDQWVGTFGQRMVTTASLTEVKGVWIIPGGGEIVASNTSAAPGLIATPQLPNLATSAVINWRIDQYYRGGKPRTYIPGVPSANTTDNVHLTTAAITAYQTAAADFRNNINAATAGAISSVTLGTVSFVSKKEWRDTPLFFKYNGAAVRSVLGTQRRRLLT